MYSKIEISISTCPLKAGPRVAVAFFEAYACRSVGTPDLVGLLLWFAESACGTPACVIDTHRAFPSLFNLSRLDSTSVSLEIKFCFCDTKDSFGSSASEPSFVFAAFNVSDGRQQRCQVVSFEIKFCFCDEASFGFSASKASFGFASFGISISTNCVSKVFFHLFISHFSQENPLRESERLMQCQGTFPSLAWKNADSSTIPWQEVGNYSVKSCISLHGQNLNLQLVDQQLHSQPRTFFELVVWLSSETHLKSCPMIIDTLNRMESEIWYTKWGLSQS